jgi:CRP-like cAMP-binding protein
MLFLSAMPVSMNRLLRALPSSEFKNLARSLEPIKMKRGEVVYQPDEPIKYVYFPETCIISQLTVFSDGSSVESGIVGREGIAGVSVALSQTTSSREAWVQTPGNGFRIETERFREALDNSGLHELVLEFSATFYEQVAQAGACSNHHSSQQRLARLLLMIHDRVDGDRFSITHEFIAQMLGIHRPSVTIAALEFKTRGLIDYSRGAITIEDREGLKEEACECYDLISKTYRNYLELLELRYLNHRMETVNREMAEVLQKRREAGSMTAFRIGNLERVIHKSRIGRSAFPLCALCHRVHNEYGDWQKLDDFVENYRRVSLIQDLCPACRAKV